MSSVNKVILVGNLGRDPEVRSTQSGEKVCNMTLATTTKRGGEEHTEWHRLVVFGKLADICEKYLKKGKSVYIEGRIQSRKWTDKENQERTSTDIIVSELTMLGGKSSDEGDFKNTASAKSGPSSSEIPF